MLRDCEYEHLQKNNYVMTQDGVVVTNKLWLALLKNKENYKVINSLNSKIAD